MLSWRQTILHQPSLPPDHVLRRVQKKYFQKTLTIKKEFYQRLVCVLQCCFRLGHGPSHGNAIRIPPPASLIPPLVCPARLQWSCCGPCDHATAINVQINIANTIFTAPATNFNQNFVCHEITFLFSNQNQLVLLSRNFHSHSLHSHNEYLQFKIILISAACFRLSDKSQLVL